MTNRSNDLRATGWDESSSMGRAGDTELTRRDTEVKVKFAKRKRRH